MDITFMPVFDVEVSEDEFIAYFVEQNVDYPKLKNGSPNMSRKSNKDALTYIKKMRCNDLMLQYGDLIKQKQIEKQQEACMFRASTAKTDNCPICYEEMIGFTVLECAHAFCVKCTINHFRVNNTCPLCRAEVCEKTKQHDPIPMETIHSIVETEIASIIPTRHNQDMYNYIYERFDTFSRMNDPDIYIFTGTIFEEIRTTMFDVSIGIRNWYDM